MPIRKSAIEVASPTRRTTQCRAWWGADWSCRRRSASCCCSPTLISAARVSAQVAVRVLGVAESGYCYRWMAVPRGLISESARLRGLDGLGSFCGGDACEALDEPQPFRCARPVPLDGHGSGAVDDGAQCQRDNDRVVGVADHGNEVGDEVKG